MVFNKSNEKDECQRMYYRLATLFLKMGIRPSKYTIPYLRELLEATPPCDRFTDFSFLRECARAILSDHYPTTTVFRTQSLQYAMIYKALDRPHLLRWFVFQYPQHCLSILCDIKRAFHNRTSF